MCRIRVSSSPNPKYDASFLKSGLHGVQVVHLNLQRLTSRKGTLALVHLMFLDWKVQSSRLLHSQDSCHEKKMAINSENKRLVA